MREFIPIMEPDLSGNEKKYLMDAIDSGWISSKGKYVERLENDLASYHNIDYALAVSNGTVALHLGMVSLGIGDGDEVIVPNLTFASSINTIIHAGATPVLADVSPETYNVDCTIVEKYISKKTKAIMVVHLYGNPCDMEAIEAIAKKHNLLIIEDSAEALGSTYQNRLVGTFGDVGTFSFYGNKTITTGEGGAILFKSQETYEYAKVLRDHGMSTTKRYWHDHVGYNYRLTNLQAAIGCAQLERISDILKKKEAIVERYKTGMTSLEGVKFQTSEKNAFNSHWLFTPLFENLDISNLSAFLAERGIETRPSFYPISDMPIYSAYVHGEYPISQSISNKGLCLPSYPGLSLEEIDFISETMNKYHE